MHICLSFCVFMAHAQSDGGTNIASNKTSTATISTNTADEVKPTATVFHDFLGKGSAQDSSLAVGAASGKVRQPSEASPSASLSIGASSGGGRGPISTTSDLGSERHTGNHFEGVPFYGQRSELIGPETSNTFIGTKRSNSDSYVGTSRDRFPPVRPDSLEGSQLMKLLRNAGGERPRRPHDEESSLPMHLIRPISASLMSQPSPGFRADANNAKFDRAIQMNVGQTWQYPPRSSQVVPYGHPSLSNKLRDSNLPPVASQGAADEGSRTGIKGSGILSSVNTSGGFSDRIPSGVLLCSSKQKSHSEPESSMAPSRQGVGTSAGCQMTIFYGGQAHVFDNVHPNKADIIMALAGSNGGSWSTSYAPKGIGRPTSGENCTAGGKNDIGAGSSFSLQPEVQAKSSVRVNSFHGLTSGDGATIPSGNPQEGITTKEPKTSTRTAEFCGDKRT